jgi:hypothetical protein
VTPCAALILLFANVPTFFELTAIAAGLYLWARGFRQFARHRNMLHASSQASSADAQPAPQSEPETNELTTPDRFPSAGPSAPRPQVIRLSAPSSEAPAGMTQQSKIAAALLKAGIRNPVVWDAAEGPEPGAPGQRAPQVTEIVVKAECQPDSAPAHPNVQADAPAVELAQAPALAWKALALVGGGTALALVGLYYLLEQVRSL